MIERALHSLLRKRRLLLVFAAACSFAHPSYGELQSTLSLSAPVLSPGGSGAFTATQVSGAAASTTSTLVNPYAGVAQYQLSSGTGRFATISGTRYGVLFDSFQLFQSFLANTYFTIVSSTSPCPVSTNYNWSLIRFRSPDAPTNPMDATNVSTYVGGTLAYNPAGTPVFTSANSFNLAGPTSFGAAYSYDNSSYGACASGTTKVQASAGAPLDAFGTFYFGTTFGFYIGSGGNPQMAILLPQQTLTAGIMSNLNKHVLSGLLTGFTSKTVHTHQNIYVNPDAAGTTFALNTVNSFTDPTAHSAYGTVTCTSLNVPANGFCTGTITIGGQTGKVICQLGSTSSQDVLTCNFQMPGQNAAGGSIIATRSSSSLLSVSLPATAVSTAPNTTTTVAATLQNLTGSYIATMADPAVPAQQLQAPFSDPSAYTGAGGTCGAYLNGFSSCTLNITYAPTTVGTTVQTFRVAYNNQVATVNGTSAAIGASGLTSLAISPNQSSFASGTSSGLTVTATYSNGSTQNVTNAVAWSTSSAPIATVDTAGTASFVSPGSVTLTASLAGVTGSISPNVYNYPPDPTGLGSSSPSYTQINLNWTSGGGSTTAFQIAYQLGATAPADCNSGTVVGSGIVGNATAYGITGLLAGAQYSFRVCAVGAQPTYLSAGVTRSQSTTTPQYIFATSGLYNGNLGSFYFADYACQAEATTSGLGGIWRAVLSDAATPATAHIALNQSFYNLRPNVSGGAQLISTAAAFYGGAWTNSVAYNSSGGSPGTNASWTGMTAAGAVNAGKNCTGWTSASSAVNGQYGFNTATNSTALSNNTAACNSSQTLYCTNLQAAAAAPANPTSFTNYSTGSTAIAFSWASGGGTTAAYKMAYQTGASAPANCNSGTIVSAATLGLNPVSYNLAGLTASTQYSFRLCAQNSDLSAPSAGVTLTITTLATGQAASTNLGTKQVVFATTSTYQGSFGGLYYGDYICQTEALSAGLAGVWKAVLSDDTTTAISRLSVVGPIYNFRPTGSGGLQIIAPDSATFWSSSLTYPLNYNAAGTSPGSTNSWTGSTVAGAINTGFTCTSWTTGNSAVRGEYGANNTTGNEMANGNVTCNTSYPLYCTNQQTASAAPPNPTGFATYVTATTSIQFVWTSGGGTTAAYQLAYQAGAAAPANCTAGTVIPASTLGVNPTNYSVTGLTASTQYSFRLCAENSDLSSASAGVTSTVTTNAIGQSPTTNLGTRQVVFSSSNTYLGNFGGLYFGDYICQNDATNAGLTGTWKAILSDGTVNAVSRITIPGAVYNNRAVASGGGQLVASDSSAFWSASLLVPLQYSASGTTPGSTVAWTGSTTAGAGSANICTNWTTNSSGVRGQYGNGTTGNEVSNGNNPCNNTYGIYCTNQQTASAAPSDPTGFATTVIASTYLSLAWSSGGGTTAAYQMSYQTGATAPASCTVGTVIPASTLGVNPSNYSVTGLTASTQYSFRLCAQNSDLSSPSAGITLSVTTLSTGQPAQVTPGSRQIVFETSGTYYGNFGGINFADYACQTDASAAGFSGVWKAIISDESTGAASRLTVGSPIYNNRSVASGGAQIVATDSATFWGSSNVYSMIYNASGNAPGANVAWTGSTSTGTINAGFTCNSWTTASSSTRGQYGNSPTGNTFSNGNNPCNNTYAFYCTNQQTASAAPPNPVNFQTYTVESTAIQLVWASGGGTTAAYQLAYQAGGTAPANCTSGTVVAAATLGMNPTIYTVTGLTASTQYSFRVCAENSDLSSASAGATLTATTNAAGQSPTINFGTRQVIVTTTTGYQGAFGGLYFADFACQLESNNAGAGGVWKAVIGDDSTSMLSRITMSGSVYNNRPLSSGGAQLAASDSSAFYGGSVTAPFQYTINGTTPAANVPWTGATSTGTINTGFTCNSWTTAAAATRGQYGNDQGTGTVISSNNNPCNNFYPFYCTNQQTSSAAPADPVTFSAYSVGPTAIGFVWTSGGGTTAAYQLAYQTGATAPANCNAGTVVAASTMGVNPTTYAVSGLFASTQYSFRLCAENSDLSSASTGRTLTVTTSTGSSTPTLTYGTTQVIFITPTAYAANFGGLYYGDYICQNEANNAGISGTWKALLSDEATAASARIVLSTNIYNNRPTSAGGIQFLSSGTNFWSANYPYSLYYSPTGNSPSNTNAWSGSSFSGGINAGLTCTSWTTNVSGNGEYAAISRVNNTGVIDNGSTTCANGGINLICINQQGSSATPPNPATFTPGAVTTGSIGLAWTSGGGSTAAYQISYQTGATAPANCATGTLISAPTLGVNPSAYTVTGLSSGTQYSFRLCAQNSDLTSASAGRILTVTTTATAATANQSAFSTLGTYRPNFGGIYFADFICQTEATAGGLSGIWKSILSDNGTTALSRISLAATIWNMTPLQAATSGNFWSGVFTQALNLNAAAGAPGNTRTWTGSTATGGINVGKTCQGWTSLVSTDNGEYGNNNQTTNTNLWAPGSNACNVAYSLYCINQQTSSAAPANPTGFVAYETGPNSIGFNWASGGGTTAAYQMSYQAGATAPASCTAGTLVSAATLGFNPSTYTITGLTAGTQYSFRLCAANSDSSAYSAGVTLTVTTPASGNPPTYALGANQYIFATTQTYNGSFGGIYFGDYICQTEATSGGLPGIWKSLTGDGTTAANAHVALSGNLYNLRAAASGGSQKLSDSSTNFYSNLMNNNVTYTALGLAASQGATWTGATTAGASTANHCSNWTSASGAGIGQYGRSNANTSYVTNGTTSCNGTYSLFCVNQQTASATPANPASFSAYEIAPTTASFIWSSGGGTTAAYRIAYQTGASAPANCNSGSVITDNTLGINPTTYTVTNLATSTQYSFRLCAYNSDISASSAGITVTLTTAATAAGGTYTFGSNQFMFATTGTYTGNFGGLSYGDFICQLEAGAYGAPGIWKAVLSDSGTTATSRIALSGNVYNLRGPASGGSQKINDSTNFWSGSFYVPVGYTANSLTPPGTNVWTGSTAAGAGNTYCSDWKSLSSSINGTYGRHSNSNSVINTGNTTCNTSYPIFCINQQTAAVTPANPATFAAYESSPTTVGLIWTSGGGTTAAYQLAYQTGATAPANCTSGSIISASTLGVNPASYTVTGLANATQYSFRLCAENSNLSAASAGLTTTVTTQAAANPPTYTLGSTQFIFATTGLNYGSLGGLYYADFICQTEAVSAGVAGIWKAVLSDSTTDATTRIALSGNSYNLRATASGGAQKISDSSNFWNGNFANAVGFTALGAAPNNTSSWTGSTAAGVFSTNTCSDWTSISNTANGTFGRSSSTTSGISNGTTACNGALPVYCMNQQTSSAAPANPVTFANYLTSPASIGFTWGTGGGTTAAYQIAYQTGAAAPANCNTGTIVPATTLGYNPNSYTVTGLSASTQYSFRLCAENSDLSSASVGRTLTVTTLATGAGTVQNLSSLQSIFVTSGTYQGYFGGLFFGDYICQTEAINGGLTGTWRAILSDESVAATTHISLTNPIYNTRSFASGGIQQVSNGTGFWAGPWNNATNFNASGGTVGANRVWSGTTNTGASNTGLTCTSWTTANSGANGTAGQAGSPANAVTNTNQACSSLSSLYCISQQSSAAAPADPATFTAYNTSNTSIGFIFSSGGGSTGAYQMAYQTGATAPANCNTGTVVTAAALGVNPTTYTVTGLTSGTQYSFRLCAENSDLTSASTGLTLTVPTSSSGSTMNLGTNQFIFVTAGTYYAAFGSVYPADYICQNEASSAGLPGIWRAIMSDGSVTAASHINLPGNIYNFRPSASGGSQNISNSTSFFTNSNLNAMFYYSATGATPGTFWGWTGSTTAGLANGVNVCSDWSTNSSGTNGTVGRANVTTSFVSNTNTGCNTNRAIFCMNQQSSASAPPDATGFSANTVAPTSIGFTWATAGGTTAAFQMAYRTGGTAPVDCNSNTVVTAAALGLNPTSYTVSGLSASTQYSFRLCAENSDLTAASTGVTLTITTPASGLTFTPGSNQYIFTTATAYSPNFGGLYYGDFICQVEANAAGLSGIWKALLSDDSTSANTRVTLSSNIYNTRPATAGGSQLIATSSYFYSGIDTNVANYTATGGTPASVRAWTGTLATGALNTGRNCVGWTSNSAGQTGTYGLPASISANITSANNACNVNYSLYCLNQQTSSAIAINPATFANGLITTSSIVLNWTAGGGTTAAYQIAYQLGATAPADCTTGTVISASTVGINNPLTYTVTGLSSAKQYSFRLCAENSDSSAPSVGRTLSVTTN